MIICVLSNTMDLNGRKTMNFTHAGLPFVLAALAAGACTQTPNQSGFASGGSSKLDDDDSDSGDDGKPDPADDDEGVDTSGPGDTSAPNDDDEDPTNAGTTIQPPRLDVAPITTLEGGNTTETCADANVVITPGEATIMLLIDRSSSMIDPLGNTGITRWEAVGQSLFGANSAIAAHEVDVQFGMTLYTNDRDLTNGCPDLNTVSPMFNNYAAMQAEFQASVFEGKTETPTAESLSATAEALQSLTDGSSKAILLVTDGEPDSCENPDGWVVPLRGDVIREADRIFNDLGIPIFVIAIASMDFGADSYDHLQDLANVGIGAARYYEDPELAMYNNQSMEDWVDTRTPANPGTLYTVENVEELGTAFGTLISNFVPCDFKLNGEVVLGQQCRGSVSIDGRELECGVDWEVSDPSTLTLLPPACMLLQDGRDHDVDASFPCEIFVVG